MATPDILALFNFTQKELLDGLKDPMRPESVGPAVLKGLTHTDLKALSKYTVREIVVGSMSINKRYYTVYVIILQDSHTSTEDGSHSFRILIGQPRGAQGGRLNVPEKNKSSLFTGKIVRNESDRRKDFARMLYVGGADRLDIYDCDHFRKELEKQGKQKITQPEFLESITVVRTDPHRISYSNVRKPLHYFLDVKSNPKPLPPSAGDITAESDRENAGSDREGETRHQEMTATVTNVQARLQHQSSNEEEGGGRRDMGGEREKRTLEGEGREAAGERSKKGRYCECGDASETEPREKKEGRIEGEEVGMEQNLGGALAEEEREEEVSVRDVNLEEELRMLLRKVEQAKKEESLTIERERKQKQKQKEELQKMFLARKNGLEKWFWEKMRKFEQEFETKIAEDEREFNLFLDAL
eukprot:comp16906_c0_seq1/m.15442 comp16906_c0_seq1/g.15442  ORF comp16906_c0_seq1/g.15442 comp16906_c0_seq1/m.15442 type:complete len:414 (-) comp16906_c0_seq1:115-1356(-)